MFLSVFEGGREKLAGHHPHRPEAVPLALGHLEGVQEGRPLPPEGLRGWRRGDSSEGRSEFWCW